MNSNDPHNKYAVCRPFWILFSVLCMCTLHAATALAALLVLVLFVDGVHAQRPQINWPSPSWEAAIPSEVSLKQRQLDEAKRYALTAGGSGMIVRHGKCVLRWGDQSKRYDIKSATKSFGATMLGIAIKDGKLELSDFAQQYHDSFGVPPESNAHSDWLKQVSILHLATQTSGFAKRGGYEKLLFAPGTKWHYSDGGPNWLAECLTLQYGRDLRDILFARIFSPIGIKPDDLHWRNNQYRDHEINGIARREFGAGIHANVEAMSRLGYLYLHEGRWKNEQLLTKEFVRLATQPVKSVIGIPEWDPKLHGNASDHYGLLWWNNADGALKHVPRDAFWAWGLYDSLIVVIPSVDLVVVRAGERGRELPRTETENHYDVLGPFLRPIVEAAGVISDQNAAFRNAPYPPSDLIIDVKWDPRDSIIRKAKGSDNWPITWGDDDLLYTAYGDGWGFHPMTEQKLSLGIASVEGSPKSFRGRNIRSNADQLGQGPHGKKASGMLMVDGVLYMMVRNAGNSQLGWSSDRGKTWDWADWKWKTSFGCPTFLNFGKAYAGVPEQFRDCVYLYSHDNASAYEPSDRMVLARVSKDRIRSRNAYEFFAGVHPFVGNVNWTSHIEKRKAVFVHPGNCYRSGITYNAGIKRFLWCQTLPGSKDPRGPRFHGGFGIYESPFPWGPWKTAYFTEEWDVGPGETGCLPTKWMSGDGRTLHFVFSGNDHFSVRRVSLVTK